MNNEFKNGIADNISTAQITDQSGLNNKPAVKPKRRYNIEPPFNVLKPAKRQFMRQVIKNNETKRGCIQANISNHYDDELRFWLDFNKKTAVLLDSMRFNEYCEKKNHIAKQVAEHVLFEGKEFYNAILKGEYSLLDEMAYMFNNYLFQDTENIYDKPKQIEQVATS